MAGIVRYFREARCLDTRRAKMDCGILPGGPAHDQQIWTSARHRRALARRGASDSRVGSAGLQAFRGP